MELNREQQAAYDALEVAEKQAGDAKVIAAMKPGDMAKTSDGRYFHMNANGELVQDNRTRKQRRVDAAKARK